MHLSRTNEWKACLHRSSNQTDAAAAAAAAAVSLWRRCDVVVSDDDKFNGAAGVPRSPAADTPHGNSRTIRRPSDTLRSSPFYRSHLVIDSILLLQLAFTMSNVNSFIICPDVLLLLYVVTLLAQMSQGKRFNVTPHGSFLSHFFILRSLVAWLLVVFS